MSTNTETNTEQIRFLGDRLEAQAETLARVVNERNRLRAALQTIADYPSGYKHSDIINDKPTPGKDREEMIHLARSVLRDARTTTTGQEEG